MHFGGGDGDTEADSEVAALHNDRMEDEWQGVEEGDQGVTQLSDGGSAVDEEEMDEQPLDQGLGHYEG